MHKMPCHWKDTYETISKFPSKKRNKATGNKVRISILTLVFKTVLKVLDGAVRQENEINI